MLKRILAYTSVMILFWGSHASVVALTMKSVSRHTFLFYALLSAAVCLFPVIVLTGRLRVLRSYSWKDVGRLVFAGVFGYFFYYFLLFWALDLAEPRDAVTETVIVNYLFPMCTLLASAAIVREKLTVRGIGSGVICFVGVCLVVSRGDFTMATLKHPFIDLLAFLAAVSWGIFSALGRRWHHEPLTGIFIFTITGLVISGCILPFTAGRHYPVGWEIYGAFHCGFFCNTVAVILWFLALKQGGASLVGNLALLAAFVNLAFIRLLLPGQTIPSVAVVGLSIIILGTLLSQTGKPRIMGAGEVTEPPAP